MSSVRTDSPHIADFERRVFNGGGAKFGVGDTLFARITPCTENGKTALIRSLPNGESVAFGSTEFTVLGPRDELTLPAFIYYTVKAEDVRQVLISRMMGSSGRQRVPNEAFREIVLGIPPLPEQRKIAAILSSVDEVIEKAEVVIEELQAVKKAMMWELLTRGLPGRRTRFKQTEIGEIPADWELVRVDQVCEVSYGLTVNSGRRLAPERRPYLTVANLQQRGFVLDTVKQIGFLNGDAQRYECRRGDVLVVEGNANPARVGCSAVWSGAIPGALHQNHLIRVRAFSRLIEPSWLSACINSARGRHQIEAAAKTTSGLHTINSTVVSRLLLPLPPLSTQREIDTIAQAVEHRRECEAQYLSEMRALKIGLASLLLTGEVRVTPAEPAA